LERSLSVLLPVRDVQSALAAMVLEMLDVLPELTSRFEIVVIDDGSVDATLEVADELVSRYPQIRAVRHARPLGRSAAIRTGLRHSAGDVVFLRDPGHALALDQVRKLWRAIEKHPLVLGRPGMSQPRDRRWGGWNRRDDAESFRMVDRRAMQEVKKSLDEQALLMASAADQGDRWYEVEVCRRTSRPAAPLAPRKEHPQAPRSRRLTRSTDPEGQPATGPKYVRSLKNFALGE
jgi:hypothetical protein